MKQMILMTIILLLLTGCWNNVELDSTAIVHGVGLDKSDDKLHVSVEIIKPGSAQDTGSGATSVDVGEHIVLEEITETLLDGSRNFIKYTKKRLDFGHTEAWIIGERLAKEDILRPIDVIRRDQMLRLNSYLFITKESPTEILNTPTFYEHLVSSELTSSIQQTKFTAEYIPNTFYEFYKLIGSPVPNAYIPIIYIAENNDQKMTAIDGTAVIKDNKMVGQLSEAETTGLNFLLNKVKSGSIEVELNKNEKVSLEISKLKTKTTPKLIGNKLDVKIETEVTGTLADNMTPDKINEKFFREIEEKISEKTKHLIQTTLDKLQQELKTDITGIGIKTYRKYPKEWKKVHTNWNDIFANANIDIEVKTDMTHQRLINESIPRHKEPNQNPYFFSK